MSKNDCVVFDNACKTFGSLIAVDRLSLNIRYGCIYGFIGPNGAGKTTAMRMLVGISRPSEGSIAVLGSDSVRDIRSQIGYLPEERGIYKRMRVTEFITYFGYLNGMTKKDAQRRAGELLEQFELTDWQKERCQALSKGMSQKLQIIATIVHQPVLLVLDEPFSGLDPLSTDLMRTIVLDLAKKNCTIVLSTHIMEQAEILCDDLVLINKGKAVLEGPLDEIRRGDHIYLEHEGDPSTLEDLPGVVSSKQIGRGATLTLGPDVDTRTLLQNIVERTTVTKFDSTSASLHEIFIRTVGDDGDEEEATSE